jgi:hypothetical protein
VVSVRYHLSALPTKSPLRLSVLRVSFLRSSAPSAPSAVITPHLPRLGALARAAPRFGRPSREFLKILCALRALCGDHPPFTSFGRSAPNGSCTAPRWWRGALRRRLRKRRGTLEPGNKLFLCALRALCGDHPPFTSFGRSARAAPRFGGRTALAPLVYSISNDPR